MVRSCVLQYCFDCLNSQGPVSFDAAGGRKGLTFIEQFYSELVFLT